MTAILLIVVLVGLVAMGGCLFGKKGGDLPKASNVTKVEEMEVDGHKARVETVPLSALGSGHTSGGPTKTGGAPGAAPVPGAPGAAPKAGVGTPLGLGVPKAGAAGDPAKATKLAGQALSAKKSGNYDQALTDAKQAASADPKNKDAHWVMAWVLAERKDKAAAITEFNAFKAAAAGDSRVAAADAALKRLGAGAGAGTGSRGGPGTRGPGAPRPKGPGGPPGMAPKGPGK